MPEQSNARALKLAAFWTMKNDQGEYLYSSLDFREETAEELRRLHEENQRLRGIVPECLERLNDELCDENERLKVQRDALLEALKAVMSLPDHLVDLRDEAKKARTVIKSVEE